MNGKLVKASSVLTLFVLMSSVVASNTPAFAINGHGVSYGPQFGAGPYVTYSNGLQINSASFDISKYSTAIKTQTLFVNQPSDITIKIYHHANPQYVQHGILFLNLQGNDPQSYQTNTYIEWDKQSGVSKSDPKGLLKSATASAKYSGQFMYLTFHIIPAKAFGTSHIIVRTWDTNHSNGQVIVLDAIKAGYTPKGFSSTNP